MRCSACELSLFRFCGCFWRGACDVGQTGGGGFGGSGAGCFLVSCRFKNVVDQFEWEFTGMYGPYFDGTEDYFRMSYLVF